MIVSARKQNFNHWLYSTALISLPLIYMGFALFSEGKSVVLKEFLYGLPFIAAGFVCLLVRFKASGFLIAILWLLHSVYDLFHPSLFINSGVPGWYPLLCAVVDLVVGGYLVYYVSSLSNFNIKTTGENA